MPHDPSGAKEILEQGIKIGKEALLRNSCLERGHRAATTKKEEELLKEVL